MARYSLRQCMDKGYQHVQSANFWAAIGNDAAERHALTEARFWFEQPQVLEIPGREKADPLLAQVDTRLEKVKSLGTTQKRKLHSRSPRS